MYIYFCVLVEKNKFLIRNLSPPHFLPAREWVGNETCDIITVYLHSTSKDKYTFFRTLLSCSNYAFVIFNLYNLFVYIFLYIFFLSSFYSIIFFPLYFFPCFFFLVCLFVSLLFVCFFLSLVQLNSNITNLTFTQFT